MTIPSDFADAIERAGLTPPESVQADGVLHRFRSGDERDKNGFYRLAILPARDGGEIGFGLIGCWKRGVKEPWCSRERGSMSPADRAGIERARASARQSDDARAAEAAAKACRIWGASGAADPAHPYLVRKQIGPHVARQYRDSLVVPVRVSGKLASLQFIFPDGSKRFLSGGHVEGGFAWLPGAGEEIVIAEGFATGASLREALGCGVTVAFNAANLTPVAVAVRALHPTARITVAADDDRATRINGRAVNVGLEAATRAALRIGAAVALPPFDAEEPALLSDWNDFAATRGTHALREAFRRRERQPSGRS